MDVTEVPDDRDLDEGGLDLSPRTDRPVRGRRQRNRWVGVVALVVLLAAATLGARRRWRPTALPRLESYRGLHEIRRCALERFPYLVIFVCRPDEAVVVAISHARRHPLYWVERLR